MKKNIYTSFCILILSYSVLVAKEKNVSEKFINDVLSYYTELPEFSDEYSVFWEYVRKNNIKYQEFINNHSNLKYNTIGEMYSDLSLSRNLLDLFTLDSLLADDGISFAVSYVGSYKAIKGIWIYPENIINAAAYPTGEIFVGLGLLNLPRKSDVAILGVIAHEIAHICLDHSEVYAYNQAKTERKNEIWGSIAAGAVVAAVAASSIYSASNDVTVSNNYYEEMSENSIKIAKGIKSSFNESTILKTFQYSREHEIEADIIACMFIKWIGNNPNDYIDFINILPTDDISDKYNTHPSNSFRVNTLRKIFQNDQHN